MGTAIQRFTDVAGAEEEKLELAEVVEFLKQASYEKVDTSNKIINTLNGSIRVSSEENKGAEFSIIMPDV